MNSIFPRTFTILALLFVLGCSKAEPQPAPETIPNIKPGRAAEPASSTPGTKPAGGKGAMKPM